LVLERTIRIAGWCRLEEEAQVKVYIASLAPSTLFWILCTVKMEKADI
jgi:hypothetical protein